MKKFNTLFNKIILENYKIYNLSNLYKKINVINNNYNIIQQSQHLQINYGKTLINKLIQYEGNIIKFDMKTILKYLNKNWKYFNKFNNFCNHKNNYILYVYITDFSIAYKPYYNLMNFYNKILYNNSIHASKEGLEEINSFFSPYFLEQHNYGINCYSENHTLLCINSKSSTSIYETMCHQLTHFFQNILNIFIFNSNINYTVKQLAQIKKYLYLSETDLYYIFNEKQFYTHIYVDLFNTLNRIYYKFYHNITWKQFITNIFNELNSIQIQNLSTTNIYKLFSKQYNSNKYIDYYTLKMLYVLFYLNKIQLINKIKTLLINK